jgi:hypothetical protein
MAFQELATDGHTAGFAGDTDRFWHVQAPLVRVATQSNA